MTKMVPAPVAESFEPIRHSPLSGLTTPRAGVEMCERAYVAKINLRGNADDPSFRSVVETELGLEIPLTPNTFATNDNRTIYWLGPDEWLIHCPGDDRRHIQARLRQSLTGTHCALTDVSDYYLVIRLTGDKARDVLSKATPFDVHRDVFTTGACAQTRFSHAGILLSVVDEAPTFDIQVRWSFAEYVWKFLVESTREYDES